MADKLFDYTDSHEPYYILNSKIFHFVSDKKSPVPTKKQYPDYGTFTESGREVNLKSKKSIYFLNDAMRHPHLICGPF